MTTGRRVRESGARCGTCARGADDAVVDVGAAVDGDLQTVVGVVVLRRLVVGVELTGGREEERWRSESSLVKLQPAHHIQAELSLQEAA